MPSPLTKMTARAKSAEDKLKESEGRSTDCPLCWSFYAYLGSFSPAALQKAKDDAAAAVAERDKARASLHVVKDKQRASRHDPSGPDRRRRRRAHSNSDDEASHSDPPPTPAQEYAHGVLLAVPDWAPAVGDSPIPRPKGTAGSTYNLAHEMGFTPSTNYYYLRIRVSTSKFYERSHWIIF